MLSNSRHVWAGRASPQIHKEGRKQVREHVTLSCQEPLLWKQEDVEIENPVDSLEMTVKGLAWRSRPALPHFVPASFCWVEFSPLDSKQSHAKITSWCLKNLKRGIKGGGKQPNKEGFRGMNVPDRKKKTLCICYSYRASEAWKTDVLFTLRSERKEHKFLWENKLDLWLFHHVSLKQL